MDSASEKHTPGIEMSLKSLRRIRKKPVIIIAMAIACIVAYNHFVMHAQTEYISELHKRSKYSHRNNPVGLHGAKKQTRMSTTGAATDELQQDAIGANKLHGSKKQSKISATPVSDNDIKTSLIDKSPVKRNKNNIKQSEKRSKLTTKLPHEATESINKKTPVKGSDKRIARQKPKVIKRTDLKQADVEDTVVEENNQSHMKELRENTKTTKITKQKSKTSKKLIQSENRDESGDTELGVVGKDKTILKRNVLDNQKPKLKPKEILFWNKHYTSTDYGFGLGQSGFLKHKCPVSDCHVTTDRSRLDVVDAVLFHTADLTPKQIPTRTRMDQIWISFNMETPLRNFWTVPGMVDMFNATFSYMDDTDTDIYTPLGGLWPLKDGESYTLPDSKFVRAKTGMAAWVVSNCNAESTRNLYAQKLANYTNVDIYGKCTNRTCGGHQCFDRIEKEYYFYLAFENGYCQDYMTEKIFRTLKFDIIPVVLGAGDYTTLLPKRSYLDVRDFDSPEHLARHMEYLSKHPKEYLEYFKWKQEFRSVISADTKPRGFCRMCELLHDGTYLFKSEFDLGEYWRADRLCLVGDEERKAVHLTG